jgi:uncharacterized protein HemY
MTQKEGSRLLYHDLELLIHKDEQLLALKQIWASLPTVTKTDFELSIRYLNTMVRVLDLESSKSVLQRLKTL